MTAMYRRSLADLQVDYIDYYLLHAIGGGGMEMFNRRFMDNGMLDFLLGERDKGRIRHLGWSFHGDIDVFDKVLGMHPAVHWDFVQIQLNYVDWRHAAAYNSDWQAARCIGCGQCAPKCPQGIDIPSQMRLIDGYVEQLRRAAPGL